ncbi:MAG: hypothetical protein HYX99_01295 [Chloroflexi bacterium]|nr:hypothetical protein [Chloroflexota bacterium]
MVWGAQRAILQDTLERVEALGVFPQPVVATNWPPLASDLLGRAIVELDPPCGPFHFGRRLAEVIERHRLSAVLYMGAGAGPLLSTGDLAGLADEVCRRSPGAIVNNFYSSDLAGFCPAHCLAGDGLPERDNGLAPWLVRAGVPVRTLPRKAATQFDVDTPTDLVILQAHPGVGPHTRSYLEALPMQECAQRLRRAMAVLRDPNAEVVIAGRVGSHTWQALETGTSCRVRLFAEERGMVADGREARGEAHSLLGLHLERVGLRAFFQELAALGQAALLDSRVLFAHLGLQLSRADRFLSDLGLAAEISDPWLRDFTQAALEAPIPVVLGGHSLVSGGMLALMEAADHPQSGSPFLV